METTELSLFTIPEQKLESSISQENISSTNSKSILNPQANIESTLKVIFPEQAEERKISQTRKILGEVASSLSDEQVVNLISEFQFLIDTWLDEFEKDMFGGKTFKELLNEG